MLRSANSLLMLLLVVGIQGCTLQEGQPWGQADLSLIAGFSPEQDRLDSEGGLLTSSDYVIDIDDLHVGLSELRLVLASESGGTTAFDPANPPDGYSLCHGGHCHSADGRLVPYEEIATELAGGGGEAGFTLVRTVAGDSPLTAANADVALDPCVPDCSLSPGALQRMELAVAALHVEGVLRDRRVPARLTAELPFAFHSTVSTVLRASLAGEVGRGEPIGVRAVARFALSPGIFDGLDFAVVAEEGNIVDGVLDLSPSPSAREAIEEKLADSAFTVDVKRFDPPSAPFVWED